MARKKKVEVEPEVQEIEEVSLIEDASETLKNIEEVTMLKQEETVVLEETVLEETVLEKSVLEEEDLVMGTGEIFVPLTEAFVKDPLAWPHKVPHESTTAVLSPDIDFTMLEPNTINTNKLQKNIVNCVTVDREPTPTRDSFVNILNRDYVVVEPLNKDNPLYIPNRY